jgi:putative hydrolase
MSQQPFGDIPLFREIQRLLASGGGPVNKEIAKQVAGAIVAGSDPDARPTPSEIHALAENVHQATALLSGYTRLTIDEPLRSDLVTRTRWVTTTLDAWSWLFEHLATRYSGELEDQGGEAAEGAAAMKAAMSQIAPLLMGIQVGTLIGHLSKEALSRHDFPIPRDDDQHIFVVSPNCASVANDYGLSADQLRSWIAIQETARSLVTHRFAWVVRYFRSLFIELIDSIDIDMGALEQRLIELQSGGLEAVTEGLGDQTLPIVASERHNKALQRLQAFIAVWEGYGQQASQQVAEEMLAGSEVIDEAMARRAVSASEGENLLSGILGFSFDRKLEQSGRTFCAAVVSLKGIVQLNRVWDAPDNLPSLEEIKDPFAWMERVE